MKATVRFPQVERAQAVRTRPAAARGAVFSESAIVVMILAMAMVAVTQLLITAFKQRGEMAIESVQDQAPCPPSDQPQLGTPYPQACK